jgi:hypothetical protein
MAYSRLAMAESRMRVAASQMQFFGATKATVAIE